MAGFTRQTPKRNVNNNPNTILVIFLVLFILISIGAGVWGYYGYEGQEKLEAEAKKKSTDEKIALRSKEYYKFLAYELRLMLGEKLNETETITWKTNRDEFLKDKGMFQKEDATEREYYLKLMDDMKTALEWNDKEAKYDKTYKDRFEVAQKDNDRLKGDTVEKGKALDDAGVREQKTAAAYAKNIKDARKQIEDNARTELAAANKKSAQMVEAFSRNAQLLIDMQAIKDDIQLQRLAWVDEKRAYESKIKEMADSREKDKENPLANVPGVGMAKPGQLQPLVLDISMGKPLFDTPVGRVDRVDGKKMIIILKSEDRIEERIVKQLTFNVFGIDDKGRPSGELKATIEIIGLIDSIPRGAMAQITYQFSKDNPVLPGDLLFNLTWGTHVAVAGSVNLFAERMSRVETQSERASNLQSYIARLEDRGIIVDAYIDLNDGTVKGKYKTVTKMTRFLIRGYDLPPVKAPPPGDGVNPAKAAEEINQAIGKMRDEAVAGGLFVISPENFANVAGYRKIGGYANNEIPFYPTLPVAPK